MCFWGMLLCFLLSCFLTGERGGNTEDAALVLAVLAGVFTAAGLFCGRKLRCPYCKKCMPWRPRLCASKNGPAERCRNCGKPFVYDDEV